ncbi:MAG: hypothetical protein HOP13_03395 [Alphaproteobacteria bacterium]|nr:hypothetical protein [Alphaproteobacteria bacterium]
MIEPDWWELARYGLSVDQVQETIAMTRSVTAAVKGRHGGALADHAIGGCRSEIIQRIAVPMMGGMALPNVLTLIVAPALILRPRETLEPMRCSREREAQWKIPTKCNLEDRLP